MVAVVVAVAAALGLDGGDLSCSVASAMLSAKEESWLADGILRAENRFNREKSAVLRKKKKKKRERERERKKK